MFLAPKVKCCFTINENSIIQQHLFFKGFNDGKRLLDPYYVCNKLEGKKISAMLPRSWKKLFISGLVIPTKMRFCNECSGGKCCDGCNNQINTKKILKQI